ncbi:MAG: carbohydrate binding domain-containing protein [Thermoguttaceae bacterium]
MLHRHALRWMIRLCCLFVSPWANGDVPPTHYFGHSAVEDPYGVIAPWYRGQNGQLDFRIRIAAETLKRYPWVDKTAAVMAAPHFVFNGTWSIQPDGTISVNPSLSDWENGDIGQRSVSLIAGMVDYYRYTGDPAAIGVVTLTADYVLDFCRTPDDHPWPRFMISCPTKGKAYARANPHGFIQLDIAAQVGSQLLKAHMLTGNARYLDAAKHWADLLAEHCDRRSDHAPWPRYANPEDSKFSDRQTASVSLILQLIDDLIRLGYTGKNGQLLTAREAGERYLRDTLLPRWARDSTFGHFFWDWDNPVMACSVPCYTVDYMMTRREAFPNWQADVRNILSLMFCRLSVDPGSAGDVYSGAWAVPESSGCCGRSLQYPTMMMSSPLARYAMLSGSEWAREVARRQCILMTYDSLESGVVMDGISGPPVVSGSWFHLAHPLPLRYALEAVGWRPDLFAASRENHIVRTTSVVQAVCYRKGAVRYTTCGAPQGTQEVLRLSFTPTSVQADDEPLAEKRSLIENGYTLEQLPDGDCLVTVRHDGRRHVSITGPDPQEEVACDRLTYEGPWLDIDAAATAGRKWRSASQGGAAVSFTFEGNQVRLLGTVAPNGGRADVYLDGIKQLCGIDFWSPQKRTAQVVYYKNGLARGKHTLRIVATGVKNPASQGTQINVLGLQWSAAEGENRLDHGNGPSGDQRVIFGAVGRRDYADSQRHVWLPATEFTLRLSTLADVAPASFWTEPRTKDVLGTPDPELYRYGVFGRDFTANFTVDPKRTYSVRVKLCQTAEPSKPGGYATTIDVQGRTVVKDVDIAATAGGLNKAVDLVFRDVRPEHGIVAVRFWHRFGGLASVQAIELLAGPAGAGAQPVRFDFPPGLNMLTNAGFEAGLEGVLGQASSHVWSGRFICRGGWNLKFLGDNTAAIYPETEYRKHAQAGEPKPHGGKEALRISASQNDIHTETFQEISVDPKKTYRASVWVQGVSLRGKGFGTRPTDSAGFAIEELDASGRVISRHAKKAITRAADFTELSETFTTSGKTARVRFTLDTVVGCRWDEGHVTYDDCALVEASR